MFSNAAEPATLEVSSPEPADRLLRRVLRNFPNARANDSYLFPLLNQNLIITIRTEKLFRIHFNEILATHFKSVINARTSFCRSIYS
jgi:hypothetical protein